MAPPRKVLLAYDGSRGAALALEDLKCNRAGLPKKAVEIIVLCVADVWTAERFASFGPYGLDAAPLTEAQVRAVEDAHQAALKEARKTALEASKSLHADHPEWEVRAESSADATAWGIVKRAEEWKADLIVMGSHGRSAVGRLVRGSVSHTVVREAPCAVRVVRGRIDTRDASTCLIIGFDGSLNAEAAVRAVADRVWPKGSAARLVTAIGDPLATAVPSLRWIAAHESQQATWMRRMMDDPAERLRTAGLSVTSVVRRGDPRKALIEEAKRWDADSLFVGARGLRGIKRFLLGSVSTAVAMHAPCSVEVIRPIPAHRKSAEGIRRSGESLAAAAVSGDRQ